MTRASLWAISQRPNITSHLGWCSIRWLAYLAMSTYLDLPDGDDDGGGSVDDDDTAGCSK